MPAEEDPGERRMDAARLVPIDDAMALVRSAPDGEPSDPWPQVRDILDDARTALPDSLPLLVAAFALHRLFDITKPFPCRRLEHLPAGLGIMADDWGAAAWMAVALTACRWCGWL